MSSAVFTLAKELGSFVNKLGIFGGQLHLASPIGQALSKNRPIRPMEGDEPDHLKTIIRSYGLTVKVSL